MTRDRGLVFPLFFLLLPCCTILRIYPRDLRIVRFVGAQTSINITTVDIIHARPLVLRVDAKENLRVMRF